MAALGKLSPRLKAPSPVGLIQGETRSSETPPLALGRRRALGGAVWALVLPSGRATRSSQGGPRAGWDQAAPQTPSTGGGEGILQSFPLPARPRRRAGGLRT